VRTERHWAAVIIHFTPGCLRRVGCRPARICHIFANAPQRKVAGQATGMMTAVERLSFLLKAAVAGHDHRHRRSIPAGAPAGRIEPG